MSDCSTIRLCLGCRPIVKGIARDRASKPFPRREELSGQERVPRVSAMSFELFGADANQIEVQEADANSVRV